ncbi:EcoRII N-terminal effector-binding domain-containing protein [Candidatus Poriferisodalis sp.]|uniref:EcoRII N-terminal effector-binding domain-containing protein n=1 Tax=Candidatus Poriferisodalis sp. TaxID=3101277 RepID=UPI003B01CECF
MRTADASGWLDAALPSNSLLCAKRLSLGDICTVDDLSGSIRLPRALWEALAPGHLASSEVPPRPVVLCDSYGVRSTGELGWRPATTWSHTRPELHLRVSEDPPSSLRDPENVGAVAIFVFSFLQDHLACMYFVCRSIDDEDDVEERLGPVEPGLAVVQGMDVPVAHGGSGLPGSFPTEIPVAHW